MNIYSRVNTLKSWIFFCFSFLVLSACLDVTKDEPFDVNRWNDESDRGFFHNRNAMLNDLLEHKKLEGKTVEEITDLFQYIDSSNHLISFEVYQEWDGIDPSLTKYLNLRLNKNNVVDSVYLTEIRR
jgi:hypothetical protein